jgi:hypothetical protein
MAQATITAERLVYMVRDSEGQLVVAFWGAMAEEEAGHWTEDGNFTVEAHPAGTL